MNPITQRHAQLAAAIRGLRRTQIVGECLAALLVLTLCSLQWVATEPHQHFGLGFMTVLMFGIGLAMRKHHEFEIAHYRQRCSRSLVGFEQGYNDALACTKLHRSRDTDHMLGYEDGYVAGVDERNARIRRTVMETKAERLANAFASDVARAAQDLR